MSLTCAGTRISCVLSTILLVALLERPPRTVCFLWRTPRAPPNAVQQLQHMLTLCSFRNSAEAELVIEAVRLGHLALCKSRLSQAQRSEIRPGDVYVWLETPADATTGVPSLARWTDGMWLR